MLNKTLKELDKRHKEQRKYIKDNWSITNLRALQLQNLQRHGKSDALAAEESEDADQLYEKSLKKSRAFKSKGTFNPLTALLFGQYQGTLVSWIPNSADQPAHFNFNPLDAGARKEVCQQLRDAGYNSVHLTLGMKRLVTQQFGIDPSSDYKLRNAAIDMKLNLLTGGMKWSNIESKVRKFIPDPLGIGYLDSRFPTWTAKGVRKYYDANKKFPPGLEFNPENAALKDEDIVIDAFEPRPKEQEGFDNAVELYKECKKIHTEMLIADTAKRDAAGEIVEKGAVFNKGAPRAGS